jgi:hypothetical protein
MMRFILAPKSMEEIKEKFLQTRRWKIRRKYSENHEKEKWSIQLEDKIHAQRPAILRESNIYKVWNRYNIHPLFGGLDESLTFSHLLTYTMKHTQTSQKATITREWERDGWIANLSTSPWGHIYRKKLMTKLSLWHNTKKTIKLG